MKTEKSQIKDIVETSKKNLAEQDMTRQIMQTEVPIKLNDLLLTMPQLRTAIMNMTQPPKVTEEATDKKEPTIVESMLLALTTRRHPAIVEMRILDTVLTDTIVDVDRV